MNHGPPVSWSPLTHGHFLAPVSPGRLTGAHLVNANTPTPPLLHTGSYLTKRKPFSNLAFKWKNHTIMETFSLWCEEGSCSSNKYRGYLIPIWRYLDGALQYSVRSKTWLFHA